MSAQAGGPSRRPRAARRQAGVLLLEALIAILIFSLGVLSIVQLQAVSVKQATDAEFRATAALLASDLVSRMWGTDRTLATLTDLYGTSSGKGYEAWYQTVKASHLPGVAGAPNDDMPTVNIAPAPGLSGAAEATITLSWQAPGKDEARHEYVTVVVLR